MRSDYYPTKRAAQAPLIAALLTSGGVALAAPPSVSSEDFQALFRAADESFQSMGTRCLTPASDEASRPGREAEAVYLRSAQNLAWVAKEYNYSADEDGFARRSEHTGYAVLAYQRAFNCNPTWDNRHYLDDAQSLIDLRLDLATESEKRSLDAEDLEPLQSARGQLIKERQALSAPTCPEAPAPQCTGEEEDDDDDDRGPSARRLRVLDALALGIELDAGVVEVKSSATLEPLVAIAVSPAARFVLGTDDRHRIHLGFLYAVHYSRDSLHRNFLHSTLLAQLDYSISDKSGWLAMHASFGVGYHESYDESKRVFSPGLGVCTLDEVLCLRARGFLGPLDRDYLTVGIGLDPLRLATRRARKKSTKSTKSTKSKRP